jgi:hypothetical protein
MALIGTKYLTYLQRRTINLPLKRHRLVRTIDRNVVLSSVTLKLRHRYNSDRFATYAPPSWPPIDGLHLWNGISTGRKPWVVTFELAHDSLFDRLDPVPYLAREQCRAVLCLSLWTLKRERRILERHPLGSRVIPKLSIHYPVQERSAIGGPHGR